MVAGEEIVEVGREESQVTQSKTIEEAALEDMSDPSMDLKDLEAATELLNMDIERMMTQYEDQPKTNNFHDQKQHDVPKMPKIIKKITV